jgi:putative spermidine/putrescine transport system ATP-binding protein
MTAGVSLDLAHIAKTFPDGTKALKPTTLQVQGGETLVFLGPSGCGKTTCLRIIAGLETPDAGGTLLFGGEDVTRRPIEERNVGMVFQSYALFPNMTVAENIGYGLKVRKVAPAERTRRVREMLALCGIEALAERRVDQLSGGQRQRVALARAVAVRPRVLLLDEPLTALDAALRERLRGELDQLLRSLAITTIYVTHDQSEAMGLGDRIVVMRQGEIAQVGTPREVYFAPTSRFVAGFIGAANILEGPVSEGRLQLPGGWLPLPATASTTATVMLRPEAISLGPAGAGTWHGRVAAITFLGDRQRITLHGAAVQPVLAEAPNTMALTLGDTLSLLVQPDSLRLLTE